LLRFRDIPASALLAGFALQRCLPGALCGQRNPDKAMSQPYLGREAVRFCSILHDELTSRAAAAG
jgi:hypothetical protein